MTGAAVDPTPDRRVYYRNLATGDRGYLVQRHGADHMKLDRGENGADETRLFKPGEWQLEETQRGMNAHEIAQIAFEADKRYCKAKGKVKESKLEWLNLHDEERILWVKQGPPRADDTRRRLWSAIVKVLTNG